jgi:hypothetical protein
MYAIKNKVIPIYPMMVTDTPKKVNDPGYGFK